MILACFHRMFSIIALLAIISCGGCTTTTAPGPVSTADATLFVIVRHAEKATGDAKDPNLSETGHSRAQRMAERLAVQRMTAVYATDYRRTQQTAAPTARTQGLEIRTYDASALAADFVARLRREHSAGFVLVVGHSNTVAAIAGALCACAVAPLREDEYDRWITITIHRNRVVELEETRY